MVTPFMDHPKYYVEKSSLTIQLKNLTDRYKTEKSQPEVGKSKESFTMENRSLLAIFLSIYSRYIGGQPANC